MIHWVVGIISDMDARTKRRLVFYAIVVALALIVVPVAIYHLAPIRGMFTWEFIVWVTTGKVSN